MLDRFLHEEPLAQIVVEERRLAAVLVVLRFHLRTHVRVELIEFPIGDDVAVDDRDRLRLRFVARGSRGRLLRGRGE